MNIVYGLEDFGKNGGKLRKYALQLLVALRKQELNQLLHHPDIDTIPDETIFRLRGDTLWPYKIFGSRDRVIQIT